MATNFFTLEELKDAVEVFSSNQMATYSECCIVALENNGHTTGCTLNVTGDTTTSFSVNWSSQVKTAGYKEKKKFVEHAAETIAFFLSRALTDYEVLEEANISTGIDYWLGYTDSHPKYDPKNFIQARLEVSGIYKESSSNTLRSRVNEKKKQTAPTDSSKLPAYVAVTEFSTPKTHFEKK